RTASARPELKEAAMRFGLSLLYGLVLACAAGAAHTEDFSRESFNGVWLIAENTPALRTLDGELPPLLPEAKARYEEHLRMREAGDTYFDRATWCAGVGVPRLLVANHPFEIMVDKRQVGFFFEWNRWVRLVDMSGA